MLEVRDFLMVRTIHDQGSLARAARVLGVGQPGLTRSLAKLEARLDGLLFERKWRGVVPTDLCRALLPDAIEILDRVARLDHHMAAARGAQVQTLSIAGGAYAIETYGMVAAARMLAVHPTVRIKLVAANWAEVPGMVRERQASIGLLDLHDLGEPPDLAIEALRPQPALFVVRPGHPLATASSPRLAEILAWPSIFVGRIPGQVLDRLVLAREEARYSGHLHPAFPAMIHESPTVALAALRASDAVMAVTVPIAAAALHAGDVVPVRWREPWLAVQAGMIRTRQRRATEVEEAFLDLVRTAAQEAETMGLRFLVETGLDVDVEESGRETKMAI